MRYWFVFLVFFVGCTPNTTIGNPVIRSATENDSVLYSTEEYSQELFGFFQKVFDGLDIQIKESQYYEYRGNDDNAFRQAINEFYQLNAGFCPLDQAFYSTTQSGIYLTLTGDGQRDIRGFLYDLRRKPYFDYIYFSAQAQNIMSTIHCQTKQ